MSSFKEWKEKLIQAAKEGDRQKIVQLMVDMHREAISGGFEAELNAVAKDYKSCGRLSRLNLCTLHWGRSPIPKAIEEELGYNIMGWEGDCPFKGRESECPAYINPMEV